MPEAFNNFELFNTVIIWYRIYSIWTKRSLKGAIKQLKAKLDQRYKAIFSQFPSFMVKVKLKLSKEDN